MADDIILTADGRINGAPPAHVHRTHCAELWFSADRVFKRKLPVDLGFLDFTTLAARQDACRREVALNRRLAPDVYLGVVDVVDGGGTVVDMAVAMRRLDDDRRLSTLAAAGDGEIEACVRSVARQIAVFHAAQSPDPDGGAFADVDALRRNWKDNLAVLVAHPELIDGAVVEALARDVETYLAGRLTLIDQRLAAGMVRDGHGDLRADDIFCTAEGPRVLDCLEFADTYRIGDVLLDVAFLAMDLERLGRPDLVRTFVDTYGELTGTHHPDSLLDHFIAYRAGVRAKVACLSWGTGATGEDAAALADLARRHLEQGRVRLVLVGGLPGTGKTTLARLLSDRTGWSLLRSDELRKDLLGLAHDEPAGIDAYAPDVVAVTYAELLDRAAHLLALGESVILDATWADEHRRAEAAAVASRTHAQLVPLRSEVADDVAHRRLAARHGDASDATTAVHEAMRTWFTPWDEALSVDTSPPPDVVVERVAQTIGIPPRS